MSIAPDTTPANPQSAGSLALPPGSALDGTDKLALALYGRRAQPEDWLGGSNAKMIHDAAEILAWLASGGPKDHDIFLDRDPGHFAIRLWPRTGPGPEFTGQTFGEAVNRAMQAFPPNK